MFSPPHRLTSTPSMGRTSIIEPTRERTESGKPAFVLEGRAKALVGSAQIELSISHDDPIAMAVVLLVGGTHGPQ